MCPSVSGLVIFGLPELESWSLSAEEARLPAVGLRAASFLDSLVFEFLRMYPKS